MKKQDFTIEGTEALKKAFIEDSGFDTLSKETITEYDYLSNCSVNNKFQGHVSKEGKHFILPQDWDKAMEYVKDFWTPEFKVGDFVTTTSDWGTVKKGTVFIATDVCLEYIRVSEHISGYHSDFRHATPEEIEQYNNPKLPIINEYEGRIEKKPNHLRKQLRKTTY